MRVKFLVDFRGKLTKEVFYSAGDVVEFPAEIGDQLIAEGRAELSQAEIFVSSVPAPVDVNLKVHDYTPAFVAADNARILENIKPDLALIPSQPEAGRKTGARKAKDATQNKKTKRHD